MNESLKVVVARMASDPQFARRLQEDPHGVAAEFGLEPDQVEMLVGARVDTRARSHQRLEERLSRSALVFGGDMGGDSGGDSGDSGDSGSDDSGNGSRSDDDGSSRSSGSSSSDERSTADSRSDDSSSRESGGRGSETQADEPTRSEATQTTRDPAAETSTAPAQPAPPPEPDPTVLAEPGPEARLQTQLPTAPGPDLARLEAPDRMTFEPETGPGDDPFDLRDFGDDEDPTADGSAADTNDTNDTAVTDLDPDPDPDPDDGDGSEPGQVLDTAQDVAETGFAGPVMAAPTPAVSSLGYPTPTHDPNAGYHGGQTSERFVGNASGGRQVFAATYADGTTAEITRLTGSAGSPIEIVARPDGTMMSTQIDAGTNTHHVLITSSEPGAPEIDRTWDGTTFSETASFDDDSSVLTTWHGGQDPEAGDTLFVVDDVDSDNTVVSSSMVQATPDGGAVVVSWDGITGDTITARLDVSEIDNADGSLTRVYLFPDGRTESFTFNEQGSPMAHEAHPGDGHTSEKPPVQPHVPHASNYHGGVVATEHIQNLPDGTFVQHVTYADGTSDNVFLQQTDDGVLVGKTEHLDGSRTTSVSQGGITVTRHLDPDGGVLTQTTQGPDGLKEVRTDPTEGTEVTTTWKAGEDPRPGDTLFRVTESEDGTTGADILVKVTADGGAMAYTLDGPEASQVRLEVHEVANIDGTTTRIYTFPDGRTEAFTLNADSHPVAHESHPEGIEPPFPNPFPEEPDVPTLDDLQQVLDDLLADGGNPDGPSGQIADLLHGALQPGPDGEPATGPLADLARLLGGGRPLGDDGPHALGEDGPGTGGDGPFALGEDGPSTNDDGRVVETEVADDGAEITTTTLPDGTTTQVRFSPDGGSTSTTTAPDGTTIVLGTSPDGTFTRTEVAPDGSFTARTDAVDGSSTITTSAADGSVANETTYVDGTVVVEETGPDGVTVRQIDHPDGTSESIVTGPGGAESTTTFPDGGVETSTTDPGSGVTTVTRTAESGFVSVDVTQPDGTTTRTSGFPGGEQTVELFGPDATPVGPEPDLLGSPYDVDTSKPPPDATGPGRWISGFAGWVWVQDQQVPGGEYGESGSAVPGVEYSPDDRYWNDETDTAWGPAAPEPGNTGVAESLGEYIWGDLGDVVPDEEPDQNYAYGASSGDVPMVAAASRMIQTVGDSSEQVWWAGISDEPWFSQGRTI